MSWIRWFSEITIDDVPLVGGKNASLGEMFGELRPLGVRIPNGFAITAEAYWHLIRSAGILEEMKQALAELVKEDVDDLALRGRRLRELVYGAPLPGELAEEIREDRKSVV